MALLLSAACGGQSGAEGRTHYPGPGLPGPGSSCFEPDVDELPFDPRWIEELANGRHRSTFEWRSPGLDRTTRDDGSDERPLVFEVTQRGESGTSMRCGGVSAYTTDVKVTLEGNRSATFKGRVQGSVRGAFIGASGELSVRDALAIPGEALTGEDDPGYKVVARIDQAGIRGDLYFDAGSTGECRLATWPAGRTCSLDDREAPADELFGDSSFAGEIAPLIERERPLTWRDGSTTTIALQVEPDGSPICVGSSLYYERLEDGTRPDRLRQRVTLHVKTADERIDLRIPATVSALWEKDMGFITVDGRPYATIDHRARLDARVVGHFDPTTPDDEFDVLELGAAFDTEAVGGTLSTSSVELTNPPAPLTRKGAPPLVMENGECWGIRAGSRSDTATFD